MQVNDWVIHDLSIVQIKKIEGAYAVVSDGSFETSGSLVEDLRPLTLRNKRIIENFDIYYNRLCEISGHVGFNYPRISQYFYHLARQSIDNEGAEKVYYDKAMSFIQSAKEYKPVIDGVQLFRPAPRASA